MLVEIVLGLVATTASVIALLQTHRANELSRRVVEAQRAADRPHLTVTLFERNLQLWLIALPIQRGAVVRFPLQFFIANDGRKTAEDLKVFFLVSPGLRGQEHHSSRSACKASKSVGHLVGRCSECETEPVSAGSLHPLELFRTDLFVTLTCDTLNGADAPEMAATHDEAYWYPLDLMITYRDSEPLLVRYLLGVANTSGTTTRDYLVSRNANSIVRPRGSVIPLAVVEIHSDELVNDPEAVECRLTPTAAPRLWIGSYSDSGIALPSLGVNLASDAGA